MKPNVAANTQSKAIATQKAAGDAARAAASALATANSKARHGSGLPGTLATTGSGTVGWGNLGFTNGHINQIISVIAAM